MGYLKSGQMTGFGYACFPAIGLATVLTSIIVGAINADHPVPGLK